MWVLWHNNNCQRGKEKNKAPHHNRPNGRERLVIMANTVTYAAALDSIIAFATDNGFDNQEVLDKLKNLRAQKETKSKVGQKSQARKDNEKLANAIVDAMVKADVTEVRAAWVKDNVDGINTTPKATAVLKVAIDMGILEKNIVQKSATRSELSYTLPTE